MQAAVDYGVLGFLGFLSVITLALALERWWFYRSVKVEDFNDKRILELRLYQRLTLIATIGSNAPYIGLLGTVAGIMVTFIEIGSNSLVDTQSIMAGLALALKATAAGLIVAIPSIVFYNLLLRKAEVILSLWDIAHYPRPSSKNLENPKTRYDV
ncbi:TonB-system energizer ExbB [Helicobacter sp. MIT 05-5293]|uniref:TonB-system energizer ExbB n=1 Tax=Helicobacter sp. MIT 05-5293 TaxID=1548149 RepID=UPI0010FF575C|nr:TonB-system energizer ExbB [Helicobacter sp. MIT 05-5293]TLD81908.1 TonB-system energizer ExbB [Helicobacter sp. MIT 05-5293]